MPNYLRHLPIYDPPKTLLGRFARWLWAWILKRLIFKFYIRIHVDGDLKDLTTRHPKLLMICNHASHLDDVVVAAAVSFKNWSHLYPAAAKDYWFSNPLMRFFSQNCLQAIPIDRYKNKGEAVRLCLEMLRKMSKIWLLLYPEGTRTDDGYIGPFKRGVSMFATATNTPILFLYLQGARELMPKHARLPRPGQLTLHVGPVQDPAEIEVVSANYKKWVRSINAKAYKD